MVGTCNVLANIWSAGCVFDFVTVSPLGRQDVCVVSWVPQYHDLGLISGCIQAVVAGWRADLMSPISFLQRPLCWLQAMSRHHGTHHVLTIAPNFAYELAVRKSSPAQRSKLRLGHVLIAMNGAEPIRLQTLEAFDAAFGPSGWRQEAWAPAYGLAENCLYGGGRVEPPHVCSADGSKLAVGDTPADSEGSTHFVGVRLATQGVSLRIVNPDSCEELPEGAVGEIWLSGSSVCRGYWRQDELSAETFCACLANDNLGKRGHHLRIAACCTCAGLPHAKTHDVC